jgi:hypothetical protein
VSQEAYEFSVSADSYSLDYEDNDDVVVKITSSGRWSASSDVTWLTISPEHGNGNGEIKIKADDNAKTESRKGVVTVKSEDNSLTHQITFTQDAAPKKK